MGDHVPKWPIPSLTAILVGCLLCYAACVVVLSGAILLLPGHVPTIAWILGLEIHGSYNQPPALVWLMGTAVGAICWFIICVMLCVLRSLAIVFERGFSLKQLTGAVLAAGCLLFILLEPPSLYATVICFVYLFAWGPYCVWYSLKIGSERREALAKRREADIEEEARERIRNR